MNSISSCTETSAPYKYHTLQKIQGPQWQSGNTLLPPLRSEFESWARLQVGKLVVAYRWWAVHCTEP